MTAMRMIINKLIQCFERIGILHLVPLVIVLLQLQAYQDSYNRHDLKQLVQLWPSCPANTLYALFKEKRSGTVSLSARGTPIVQGDVASLTIAMTKQTEAGESNKSVPFQFRKQNDHWIIEKGSL
jgi:hypothetical protein